MKSLNQCQFIGNLGQDPDTRFMPDGKAVCNLSIAVSDDYTKDGQKIEQTEWIRLVAFGKLAELCNEYLQKGSKIFASGKMKTRSWEQDGIKKYATEVVLNNVQFLDSQAQSGGGSRSGATANPAGDQGPDVSPQTDSFPDEQIPF